MDIRNGALNGLIAGAAGTTALNAATYVDMAVRGRGTSSTPEDTVEKISEKLGVDVPGSGDTHDNRVSGLGALQGIAAGVGVGAALGVVRETGIRPKVLLTAAVATVAVMAFSDGVMAGLGVTDPTTWAAADWAADIVPHFAYGLVTAIALQQ